MTDVTEGGHVITGVFVPDESITLVRPAYDVKRFHPDDDDVSTYIAESIIDARGDADNREYLIHWRGFPNEFDMWEPDENVKDRSMVAQADQRWPPPPRAKKAPVPPMKTNLLQPEEIEEVDDVRNARSGLAVSFRSRAPGRLLPIFLFFCFLQRCATCLCCSARSARRGSSSRARK